MSSRFVGFVRAIGAIGAVRATRAIGVIGVIGAIAASSACKESGTVRVRSLEFKGARSVDMVVLRAALATRVGSRLPWGRQALFERARFDADLKRIEAFYTDRGYPDAHVTDVDVKTNDAGDAVALTLTIDEGRAVTVRTVRFDGFEVLPARRLQSLKDDAPVKVGEARDRARVASAHDQAVNELREYGYPYAKVSTAENDGQSGKDAAIEFRAEPGPLAHFGPFEIVGNASVSKRVIERQLTFKPGELYRRSAVQASQRRLYGLELFQFVNIEALDPERQDVEVRTRVTVAEGRHQRLNFGVGYGTDEKGRVEGEYHHVNFLGDARSAGVHARWSSLDRGVHLDFSQPYFFDPHLALGAEAQQWWTVTPAYRSEVTGGRATVTRRPSTQASWAVSLTRERTSSIISEEAQRDATLRDDLIALGLDPETLTQAGTLNAVGFDYQRSTADSLLDPRRGYQIAFHTEEAGRVLPGTFNYYAASIDGRHYQPIGARFIWAHRLQVGNIRAAADTPGNVPFGKKYFLGGATSVRGWGRYEISPLSRGLPIGGNALVAFSSEARASISGSLGAVAFIDAGNVWPEAKQIALDELRYAAGLGVRYKTPVGPIRFDFGYQLNPIPGLTIVGREQQRRWRIHFSIGQAF